MSQTCQGIVPEQRIPQSRMVERVGEDGAVEYERENWEEVVPAHPCDQPATMLARSMVQTRCDLYDRLPRPDDGVHWVQTEDRVYCAAHCVAGTMTHFDGRVTNHPIMAIEAA